MTQSNECVTVGGEIVGVSCKFTFIYDVWDDIPYVPATILRWFSAPIVFENCTDYRRSGRKWCATKVTSKDRYIPGNWGECTDTLVCNAIEGINCTLDIFNQM